MTLFQDHSLFLSCFVWRAAYNIYYVSCAALTGFLKKLSLCFTIVKLDFAKTDGFVYIEYIPGRRCPVCSLSVCKSSLWLFLALSLKG